MSPRGSLRGKVCLLGALLGAMVIAQPLPAQTPGPSLFSSSPTGGAGTSSGFASPGMSLVSPSGGIGAAPGSAAPAAPGKPPGPQLALTAPAGQVTLTLSARYGRDMPVINGGLHWRVYTDKPDPGGTYRLVKEDQSPAPTFVLPPGGYVVHASMGLASAAKPVTLRAEPVRETVELPAGGLRMQGQVGDARIPPGQILFDVYPGSQFDASGEKRAIAQNVQTGDVVLLPEGTYHIVSNYGDSNAVVRSDIRVQNGKLTDVTVTHRAAVITLKLVSDKGGEALANTAWSVLTPGGDVIKESIGAFPRVVLAEGDYRAIARNEGRVFEREFKVVNGVDGEVEVLAQ
jgi:hypothetical protein